MKIDKNEQYNAQIFGKFKSYLQPVYDSRQSFYKKAQIKEYNGALYLQSYNTIVAKIENGKAIVNGWYSATTAKHINEFLYQNGFNKMTKKEMEEDN